MPDQDTTPRPQLTQEERDALLPDLHPDQVPAFISTPEDLQRWRLCAGLSLQIAGRLDIVFMTELYNGDLKTG